MKKYTIKMSDDVKGKFETLSENEKELFCEGIEEIRRNPYTGEPTWGGWRMKIWNKILWFVREIELRIFKG